MGTAIKPTAVKKEKPEEKLKTKKIKRGKRENAEERERAWLLCRVLLPEFRFGITEN